MNVKILKVATDELKQATIRNGQSIELPSMHGGWRFNFNKLIHKLTYANAYVLVSDETPNVIEGCLIFQMRDKVIPYMAYVEIAPHNKEKPRQYEHVAGCLIAFAFKQSLIHGKGNYKGLLTFDVQEQEPENQKRLMIMYSKRYNAVKVDETTMLIIDDAGHKLIEKYLDI
jgi:hypothetical protein